MKRLLYAFLIAVFAVASGSGYVYYRVSGFSQSYISDNAGSVPVVKVAVLLGTSSYLANGSPNPYFEYRMDAAARLYERGKVSYILVSGDNRKANYNEPVKMQQALMSRGVPPEKIVLDYAGFRTLDSMVRAKEVFGQTEFVVVSQEFHNERAVYIARYYGIEAYGYNAQDVSPEKGLKTKVREVLARVKMMLDLYVLKTEPRFLGEKIIIGA